MRAARDRGADALAVRAALRHAPAGRPGRCSVLRCALVTTVKSVTANGSARDAEDVGAEVGDLLLDVEVGALHQGHHGDQRGDAHGQAEHRQRRAQLVRADRRQTRCRGCLREQPVSIGANTDFAAISCRRWISNVSGAIAELASSCYAARR